MTPKFQALWLDKDIPISPLRHLLTSNLAPSDSEIITIRALIIDAEVRIEELHRRFPTPNGASQGIESKLLKFMKAHKALLSPVRYLPSEILQEIFLRYPDYGALHPPLATIPWSLGHISHRWREIALSLPSLWDGIPGIDISSSSHAKRSYVRALTYLIQRSGASPTLKLHIYCPPWKMKIIGNPILKVIIRHSERIECLSMSILHMHNTSMREFQELRGRLPNLRVLALGFPPTYSNEERSLDVFETAPALRQVILAGSSHPRYSIRLLLPWSQITHFHDILNSERVAPYVPLSLLPSLTYLYIDKAMFDGPTPTLPSPYEPVILPGLRTLKIHGHCKGGDTGIFLESLTVPSVEVIKISYFGSLVPRLASMFSRSHEPSRLQKLAFRTISLQAGELSALLNLTPQLIELDIVIPPMYDILNLTDGAGKAMLVPMLQALYMHGCQLIGRAQTECFNSLAQVRCELDGNDSEDIIMPSPKNRNTLDMLRIIFDSAKHRDVSQVIFNDWSPLFSPEEAKAAEMLNRWSRRLRGALFKNDGVSLPNSEHNYLGMLDRLFACIEQCEAITINVLHVGFFHMLVDVKSYAHIAFPSEDTYTYLFATCHC